MQLNLAALRNSSLSRGIKKGTLSYSPPPPLPGPVYTVYPASIKVARARRETTPVCSGLTRLVRAGYSRHDPATSRELAQIPRRVQDGSVHMQLSLPSSSYPARSTLSVIRHGVALCLSMTLNILHHKICWHNFYTTANIKLIEILFFKEFQGGVDSWTKPF